MNSNESTSDKNETSIADAIFDVGLAWAEVGLAQSKAALEHTATALSKTARSLDAIRSALSSPARSARPQPHDEAA